MALKPCLKPEQGEESGSSVGTGSSPAAGANDLWRTESELRGSVRLHAERALTWQRRALLYEESLKQAVRRHDDQLRNLSAQLLLFEGHITRGWKDVCRQLSEREAGIVRLQRVVRALRARLVDAGLSADVDDDDPEDAEPDSLDDSDSAVVMEDEPRRLRRQARCWNGDGAGVGVPVARSVSDALDSQCKYSSLRRGNGFLRRPEVLETVYSVEEDTDNATQNQGGTDAPDQANEVDTPAKDAATPPPVSRHGPRHHSTPEVLRGRSDSTSLGDCSSSQSSGYLSSSGYSVLDPPDTSTSTATSSSSSSQTVYNKVMNNHRSVTKPKDVKYKRINRAKSKSLEELRGRLKNYWVDKGPKVAFSVDQSYA